MTSPQSNRQRYSYYKGEKGGVMSIKSSRDKWSNDGTITAGRRRASVTAGTLLVAVGALVLAACGGSSSHSSTATQPPGTSATAAAPTTAASAPAASSSSGPTVLMASNSKYGKILTDAKGMTLYTATLDTATKSACTGACLQLWPPLLLASGETQPVAGPGVTGLGTLMRTQGVQVTYHGKPLYTWVNDKSPGQVTGQGVTDTAGTWNVATVAGTAPASPPTTAASSSGGASF
jgi:predicted lipoprotein with Yx(FWY)xxD motif